MLRILAAIALLTLLAVLGWRRLNSKFFLLALCRRIRCVDGGALEPRFCVIPGNTIFGNNFDILSSTPAALFQYLRQSLRYASGRSYLMYYMFTAVYNVSRAEEAEEVLQSQTLLQKGVLYELLHPFLGSGLLTSTDKSWHFRRKVLTPAFHFNILQNFLEVFKEESDQLVELLAKKLDAPIPLGDVIPEFTLNNVCDTALGVKLSEIPGNEQYRRSIHAIELVLLHRCGKPLLHPPLFFRLFGRDYKRQQRNLQIAHNFSSKIIQKKRVEFQQRASSDGDATATATEEICGKKRRYAMLDTLLDAETKGLIDHQGICDEVNTFMFEGYDTTSTCLIFALLNLALHEDVQQQCYDEVREIADFDQLSVFDYNQMVYLECVIKEVLRLYPSVPFVSRACTAETAVNGLVLPKRTEINLHIYDIMRDARHWPNPTRFDPSRFLPENTTNRHPFAYIPFSAGPRNCIGQKFAILEIKVLLVAILRHYKLSPVTRLEDVEFLAGLVLRTSQQVKVQLAARV